MHVLHCSVAQRSRLIPLSVSRNSDESEKQPLYSDGDPDRHQNLTICSLAHCQPSLKMSCKSVQKFLRKVANKQINNDENISSLAEVKITANVIYTQCFLFIMFSETALLLRLPAQYP